jgi:N-acetyl-gamma-glutamyl-phosphate reductase
MKNNKTKIFIDGEVGTVGLNIRSRLQKQDGLELLQIHPDLRKDISERGKMLNSADFVFLCLPDVEAKRAVSLIENDNVRVIDASTAHRTNAEWDYGFPELSQEQYENIRTSKRVAVPGCYATGFIALVYPLITHKIISHEAMLG